MAGKLRGAGNSRHEPATSTDFFPTPAWGTRGLMEHVMKPLKLYDKTHKVWEPACGAMHMTRALSEYYRHRSVYSSDLEPRADPTGYYCGDTLDFLDYSIEPMIGCDWVITNPPFNKFIQFFERAMAAADVGVALLAPLTIIETKARYKSIYEPYKARFCIAPFVERLPIIKNRVNKEAGTARAYCWLIVMNQRRHKLPPLLHIPPCRDELEKEGDYI